jgi:magnesium chelatase subunit D
MIPRFPFSAVVGMEEVKLALLLCAVDARLGGVLLRGQKGSAKTTLARGLAGLLPGHAPFAELPVGATEDRLVGSLDLGAALAGDGRRFEPGVLAHAHGGVLYVDEVNLLPDHLVDLLLDVAASGVNRVEREGISHEHTARFVLVGSMNPEEGELRPQLLDRFGLAVAVAATTDPAERAEAVRRRLEFDADPTAFVAGWADEEEALARRLATARPAPLADELLRSVSALCAGVGAEGLRADLVTARAAAALAGWEGRDEVTADDVRRVAPLALAHRRRRSPFEDPSLSDGELGRALAEAFGPPDAGPATGPAPGPDPPGGDPGTGPGEGDTVVPPAAASPVVHLRASPSEGEGGGRRSAVRGPRGRLVSDRAPDGPVSSLAVGATVRTAAARRAGDPAQPRLDAGDLREAVREAKAGNLLVLAVDASGSMGAAGRMEAAKGAVLGVLLDAYQRRDRVAMVTFRGDGAQVALRPTGSVEVARARLAELPTGGRTPLGPGISTALEVALSAAGPTHRPLLVLFSDGRATAAADGLDPWQAAEAAAARVRKQGVDAVVVDAEGGGRRLGLARRLADAMGARYLGLSELSAGALEGALRDVLR